MSQDLLKPKICHQYFSHETSREGEEVLNEKLVSVLSYFLITVTKTTEHHMQREDNAEKSLETC